jgi:hypothetical protein
MSTFFRRYLHRAARAWFGTHSRPSKPAPTNRTRLRLESLEDRLVLSTFWVINNKNAGPGSLRQAILQANATPGQDTIKFRIGHGQQTITPRSALPRITHPVFIDGTTQPGFAGTPLIELNGAFAGPGANGLVITTGHSAVQGLVINRFRGNGIVLEGNGNSIEGTYIGTDVSGTQVLGNHQNGVFVAGASNTLIGGTVSSETNEIAGNAWNGVEFSDNVNGSVTPPCINNRVQGNWIGTDSTGTLRLGNGLDGVLLLTLANDPANSYSNQIGGSAPWIGGPGANGDVPAGVGNVIAFNDRDGVAINGPHSIGDTIRGNSIYGNGRKGIAHDVNLPQPNKPMLTEATADIGVSGKVVTTIAFNTLRLDFYASNPADGPGGFAQGRRYLGSIQVMTDQSGVAQFDSRNTSNLQPFQAGEVITATSSNYYGNTSEFSDGVVADFPIF